MGEHEHEPSPSRRRASEDDETPPNPSVQAMSKPVHEDSPLLSPAGTAPEEEEGLIGDSAVLDDDPHDDYHETKSVWYMILLTISIGGLQLAWAVELSNGTPYLLALGLSKSLMALVWIAGPLSGTLVQPYVGMLSDNCRSPWGKRVPFMAAGAAATIVSLLALAWVREIVGGFLSIFGADRESEGVKVTIIVVAVLFVYILDFAINTVQAGIRAFILDCAPSHQQEAANSMASRVVGVGNIIGYVAGYINLPKYLWIFGNTQFKILCVIACIALGSTVALSIGTIKERDPRLGPPATKGQSGLLTFFKQVFTSIRRLPPQTRKVCEVQFFAWIGFFPQLFYSSSYIGDIYVQPFLEENPNMTPVEIDQLYEKATRVGTFALLIYAITSLATNVFLPFFIAPSYDNPSANSSNPSSSLHPPKIYTTRFTRFLDRLVIPWLTLRRAWLLSHCIFALCMFSTLIVRSIEAATTLIGIVGISWALTLWAPFAIISAEVSKRDALRRSRKTLHTDESPEDQAGVILGIHNMAIAAPQILATIGSSIIFKFLQKPRGTPGDRSIAVVLAAGGLSTLVAAFLTSRIKDEVEIPEEGVVEEARSGNRREERRLLARSGSFGGLEY
ncbi:MFS general substrate transporter [Venustampulla echinocandica]|uniref:MFS general substrate transporter n=1 Tax=Venustampulla echinocandica TaxID=2656787 RepID=A0A370TUX3_9HELO|nr:MFS general substrate transporter [Venustampulla echinocandica]RDL39309.1 MFS general substrate transporter [Venustampulla echinocandica]